MLSVIKIGGGGGGLKKGLEILTGDYSANSPLETALLELESYQCPYCGESVEIVLDLSMSDQQFVEDCPVCCRPIEFELHTDSEGWSLITRTEND
jgi:hypothetical protein